jgi:hypothetical protein
VARLLRLLRSLGVLLVALVVSVAPERAKRSGPLAPWASPGVHILSGVIESLAAGALFVVGMLRAVGLFAHGPGWVYLTRSDTLGYDDFFAMGALGYLNYLVHPVTLLLVYCYGEGIVRALEAVYHERMPGLGMVALVWRGVEAATASARRARRKALLGPPRPDEVVEPGRSPLGMLEIYSADDRPWSDVQVIDYGGEFYQLASKDLVERGAHHAFRYLLHRLDDNEVIRGVIVRYPPDR